MMTKELSIISKIELIPFFTKGDQVDQMLEAIEKEAMAHVPDITTAKGRAAIKANVTLITTSKTYLEKKGKELAAEYKEIPKAIDKNRKKTKDFLTTLQAKARKQLTDWEDEQKEIKAKEKADQEAKELAVLVDSCHEIGLLMNANIDREIAEAKEQAKKEQLEREEKIRIKAAEDEKAKIEAKRIQDLADAKAREQKIIEDAEANERRIKREKQEAEDRAKQAAIDLEAEKWIAYITEAYTFNDRLDSEVRAAQQKIDNDWLIYITEAYTMNDQFNAEVKRLADIEQAKQSEIKRQQQEQEQLRLEAESREANKEHKRKINRESLQALINAGFDGAVAMEFIKAVSKNEIPHISIKY